MNEYELMTILHPRLGADDVTATVESIQARITASGGTILSTDVWGRRRLAYPIGGSVDGTYVLTTLQMPAPAAAPLESWLVVTESVIRHLLIRGIIPYAGHDREPERDRERRRDDDRDDDREPELAGVAGAEATDDSDAADEDAAAD